MITTWLVLAKVILTDMPGMSTIDVDVVVKVVTL
jgi:hypothetical protein